MTDEFEFIDKLKPFCDFNFSRNLNDDVCELSGEYIISTDTYVEKKHFFSNMCPKKILKKTFYCAISDIYAKASVPKFLILNTTFTKNCDDVWFNDFAKELGDLCFKHNVKIIGGDTTFSDNDIVISYTFFGTKTNIKSSMQHGGHVYFTGMLGGSSVALESINNKLNLSLEQNYYQPINFLDIPFIYKENIVNSFDISDGFYADFNKKLIDCNVGIQINVEDLPICDLALKYKDYFNNFYDIILNGGDDYCCIFVCDKKIDVADNVKYIGQIDKNKKGLNLKLNGENFYVKKNGYKSF